MINAQHMQTERENGVHFLSALPGAVQRHNVNVLLLK
jgi:hypothetical protein